MNREVIPFRDGLSAWSYIKNGGQADVIISDVDMPGMDGLELLAKVKNQNKATLFIVMSGTVANEEKAAAAGADAFLAKPFAINDLFDIVQAYVVD